MFITCIVRNIFCQDPPYNYLALPLFCMHLLLSKSAYCVVRIKGIFFFSCAQCYYNLYQHLPIPRCQHRMKRAQNLQNLQKFWMRPIRTCWIGPLHLDGQFTLQMKADSTTASKLELFLSNVIKEL